jgi:hypothetical protein
VPLVFQLSPNGSNPAIRSLSSPSAGASTAGADPANAYPQQLEKALQRHHPQTPITVLNKGVPRQTAREMLARFATDVLARLPRRFLSQGMISRARRAIETAL